jgi:uncharacterized protein involved in type VI secretion and phage assembly
MTVALIEQARVDIEVDGRPVAPEIARTAALMLVRQALSAPAVAELDFADPPADTGEELRYGAALRLKLEGSSDALFEGEITGIEYEHDSAHGMTLRVRAYDPLQRLRRRYRVRALTDASAVSLATELSGDLGVDCRALHPAAARTLVIQQGQSDLELLCEMAAEAGLYPVIAAGVLVLTGLDGYGNEIPLKVGHTLYRLRLARSNERALRRSAAWSWNPPTLRRYGGDAAEARQDAFDMHDVGLAAVENAEAPLVNELADTEAETKELAQARMDHAAAASAVAVGTAKGDPALSPGRAVMIDGVRQAAVGRYVITEALHRLDAVGGYRTEFSTVPPPLPARQRAPVFAIGEVSATSDPDGLGRCRVKLHAFDAIESGWLQIVSPGAGEGKGLAVLPDPGDQVLVAFPDGDLARGVVIGALFGESRLPRGLAARRSRPFVMRTSGGQALELSAEQALARLSTNAGSMLELAPSRARLATTTDLVIEAPGKRIVIRASAIDFEQG